MTTSANNSWTLTAISDSLGDVKHTFSDQLTVGRKHDNNVVIHSNQVALQHAILKVENDQLTVTDLGTVQGTFVNNTQVIPNEPYLVHSDDVISFGKLRVLVRLDNDKSEGVQKTAKSEPDAPKSEVVEAAQAVNRPSSIVTVSEGATADAKTWQFLAISDSLGDASFGVSNMLTVGRASDNDVAIDSEQVAEHHAKLTVEGGQLYVTDLGSDKGTFVHSVQVPVNEAVVVSADDVICFGSLRVLVVQQDAEEIQGVSDEVVVDVAWQLTAVTEALGDLTCNVANTLTVGRSEDNDLVLKEKEVSRNHAKFEVLDDGSLTVTDLGSVNGTFVNDNQLVAEQAKSLAPHDMVRFASFEFSVLPAEATDKAMAEAKNTAPVTPEIKTDTNITNNIEEVNEARESTVTTPTKVDTPEEAQRDAEHKKELIEEADPEVEKAREAATGQLSGIANTHPTATATSSISEPEPRPVAHANSKAPVSNQKPKSNSLVLWAVLILAALVIALWLYNSN